MKIEDAVVLLPCQCLEDLDLDWDANDANQLLAAWSALFHPAIIVAIQGTPRWDQAEQPPDELDGRLIVVPRQSHDLLPEGWVKQAEEAGAVVVLDFQNRDDILAIALEILENPFPDADQGLVKDFLAIGFCNLQVELITRQLRYMSNLDEDQFEQETLRAAKSLRDGHEDDARDTLRSAFELLTEAREYYYPVEPCLIDLTLTTQATTGEALRAELSGPVASNLLISGEVVERMAKSDPETLSALKDGLDGDKVSIVGGEFCESMISLLPPEAILAGLRKGLDVYERHLGQTPIAFGRRRFGLSPILPTIIAKLGLKGAVHFTLDDGRFPSGNQSKITWRGCGKATVEALARIPIDVSTHNQFTRLPEKLADVMDLDHAAALVLAHWPGAASVWYDDLKRADKYSPVLGKFVSLKEYFEESEHSGQLAEYDADRYRSPHLRQAIAGGEKDPISRWVRFFRRWTTGEASRAIEAMAELLSGKRVSDDLPGDQMVQEISDTLTNVADDRDKIELDNRLDARFCKAVKQLADALPRRDAAEQQGYMIACPWSFSQNVMVDEADGKKPAVVDVPSMGVAWVNADERKPEVPVVRFGRGKKKKDPPPLAEEFVLQNEFFRAVLDPNMGTIKSIHDYHSRGNRLAQQIALRMPQAKTKQGAPNVDYSVMVADDITVTESNSMVGEIVSRGRLVDRNVKRLAGYVQTTRIRRGSRVLELDVELDIDQQPGSDPWNSYYAVRLAWNDATANLYRGVGLSNVPTSATQLESPYYVDVRSTKTRTTLLTGGLPYHRRFGLRRLDTLLVVQGETARRFRLGIGIDLTHPIPAALEFLSPSAILSQKVAPPFVAASWLLHVSAKNVLITHWEPIFADGSVVGLRVRMMETEGRSAKVRLSCFRPFVSARELDLRDAPSGDLTIKDGCVAVQIEAMDWVQVEARFC